MIANANRVLVERVKTEMQRSGLNARQLAKRAKVGDSFIYDVLSGKSKNPTTTKIAAVANVLGVSVPYLLDENVQVPCMNTDYAAIPFIHLTPAEKGKAAVTLATQDKFLYFSHPWLDENFGVNAAKLRILEVNGDSMEPTLCNKDLVLLDITKVLPSPPGIFAVFDGVGLVLKRIEYIVYGNEPRLSIRSDNARYMPYECNTDEIQVIGRIVWFSRKF